MYYDSLFIYFRECVDFPSVLRALGSCPLQARKEIVRKKGTEIYRGPRMSDLSIVTRCFLMFSSHPTHLRDGSCGMSSPGQMLTWLKTTQQACCSEPGI